MAGLSSSRIIFVTISSVSVITSAENPVTFSNAGFTYSTLFDFKLRSQMISSTFSASWRKRDSLSSRAIKACLRAVISSTDPSKYFIFPLPPFMAMAFSRTMIICPFLRFHWVSNPLTSPVFLIALKNSSRWGDI